MTVPDYEAIIRSAVARLPSSADSGGRKRLYERARRTVREASALSEAERLAALERMQAAIASVEADFGADAAVSAPPAGAAASGKSSMSLAAAAGFLVLLVAVAAGLFHATGGSGPVEQGPPVSEFAGEEDGFERADGKPFSPEGAPRTAFVEADGRSVLRVTGRAQLISRARYPVDTGKRYRMVMGIRSLETGEARASRVSAGVATYDAAGDLQTDAPGPHRYFVVQEPLSAADGWQERTGFITGEGNESHETFRPGTRYVRPLISVNYGAREQAVEIDFVRFDECASPAECKAVAPLGADAPATK